MRVVLPLNQTSVGNAHPSTPSPTFNTHAPPLDCKLSCLPLLKLIFCKPPPPHSPISHKQLPNKSQCLHSNLMAACDLYLDQIFTKGAQTLFSAPFFISCVVHSSIEPLSYDLFKVNMEARTKLNNVYVYFIFSMKVIML